MNNCSHDHDSDMRKPYQISAVEPELMLGLDFDALSKASNKEKISVVLSFLNSLNISISENLVNMRDPSLFKYLKPTGSGGLR